MSQHLTDAVASLTREIDRLTQVRDQLALIAGGGSDAGRQTTQVAKRGANKRGASTATQRSERKPVSEETRRKMAEARRAYFAKKSAASKTTRKRVTAKKTTAKKDTGKVIAKKSTAKKAATKKAVPEAEA